jgi:membrane protease YdiL (CAAX protease family)
VIADVVVVVGVLAQLLVGALIARGRLRFWPATTATLGAVGITALVVGDPAWCASVSAEAAAVAGVAGGIGFYAATRAVVGVASRRPALREAVSGVYDHATDVPFALSLALSLAIAVPGEELFFRGLVLPQLRAATTPLLGAILTWLVGARVGMAWKSLPLFAGAVVGGALWTALGAWSGGVLSPLICHLLWTGAMIAWPPRVARDKVKR